MLADIGTEYEKEEDDQEILERDFQSIRLVGY